jgi:hypothetical protein
MATPNPTAATTQVPGAPQEPATEPGTGTEGGHDNNDGEEVVPVPLQIDVCSLFLPTPTSLPLQLT